MPLVFYPGIHDPHMAKHLPRVCLSIARLTRRPRKGQIKCQEILLDSGAFSELALHGRYRDDVDAYARNLEMAYKLAPTIIAAVGQDYMCEPFILAKTGLTIADHQWLTIDRYDRLLEKGPPMPILPVLQGFAPEDYTRHLAAYGTRLAKGAWVGVGSVCKRNSAPAEVANVLSAIKAARPDLRLHGFGIKLTSLKNSAVRNCLATADSMAWSYNARRNGRDRNAWQEAAAFADKVMANYASA
jgi:hypothetical protein